MARPKVRRENLVAFGTHHFYYREAYQSTDDPLQRFDRQDSTDDAGILEALDSWSQWGSGCSEMLFVTQQEYEELKANLKQRASLLSPNVVIGGRFDEFLKVAIYHFLDGAQEFSWWSRKMQDDFGESVRPHLQEIWLGMPWAARKIADRLLAHILDQVEISEVETTGCLFAEIKRASLGKYSLSSEQRVRLAALMPLNEVGRMFAESGQDLTPRPESRPNERGKVAREMSVTARQPGSLSYQCPSCGRSLQRGEVLLQEWGDKAGEYMNAEFMAQPGDYVWAHALDNFKAFHECVPVPTEDEIRGNWKRLAFRKLLRYILVGWAVLVGVSLFSDDRFNLELILFLLVACSFFFVVVIPLFVALSIPLTDVRFRTAWARKIWDMWEEWKSSLVAREKRRKRELEGLWASLQMKKRDK
jgi:hypothetical protein